MSADDQREQRPSPEALDRLGALHAAASPGPWEFGERCVWQVEDVGDQCVVMDGPTGEGGIEGQENGELIVAAVNALPDLIAAARERDQLRSKVAAVLAAHQPYRTPYREADICDTCSRGDGPDVLWPCPTAATLGDQP